jgi:hypothetical protein
LNAQLAHRIVAASEHLSAVHKEALVPAREDSIGFNINCYWLKDALI